MDDAFSRDSDATHQFILMRLASTEPTSMKNSMVKWSHFSGDI
ncbi:hypothetical protein O3S81_20555 [Agrobacterium sp. SOY23]|nr:hypothetical protein [Agrobacterium sp. SOY23]MCZ4432105.1 hypothetical protein [Agrobacterium sp. SOY23]